MSPCECSDPGEGGEHLDSGFLWPAWEAEGPEHLSRAHTCRLVFQERGLGRQSETGFKPQKCHLPVWNLSLGCLKSRMRELDYAGAETCYSSASAHIQRALLLFLDIQKSFFNFVL